MANWMMNKTDNGLRVYIYICPNCGEEYHFHEELIELRCEICGAMVIKIE